MKNVLLNFFAVHFLILFISISPNLALGEQPGHNLNKTSTSDYNKKQNSLKTEDVYKNINSYKKQDETQFKQQITNRSVKSTKEKINKNPNKQTKNNEVEQPKNNPKRNIQQETKPKQDNSKTNSNHSSNEDDSRIIYNFKNANFNLSAFKKNDWLWVIFDSPPNGLVQNLESKYWSTMTHVKTKDNQIVLRFKTEHTPKIHQINNSISIEFNQKTEFTSAPPEINFKEDGMHINVDNYKPTLKVIDPETQEELNIIFADCQINKEHKYIKYDLIKTIKGLVIKPKSDGLEIQRSGKQIIIKDTKKTSIDKKKIIYYNIPDKIFDLDEWHCNDSKCFYGHKKTILKRISTASIPKDHSDAQLDIAKLLIANNMYKEGLEYLNYINKHHIKLRRNYNLKSLEAMCYYMLEKYEQAFNKLNMINIPSLNQQQKEEIQFWINSTKIHMGHKLRGFKYNENYLSKTIQKNKFLFSALKSAVDYQDALYIADLRRIINDQNYSQREQNQFNLLQAELFEYIGSTQTAYRLYDKIIEDVDDIKNRAFAIHKKISLMKKNDEIDEDVFLNELHSIIYIWTEPKFVSDVLSYLADRRLEREEYYKGLTILRNLYNYFPSDVNLIDVSIKMTKYFKLLFNENKIDKLTYFAALKIFSEFQELIPIGDEGVKSVLKSVDIMVELDLLEQAASALAHIIEYRIPHEEKTHQIEKLFSIYLNNKQYQNIIDLAERNKDINSKKINYFKSYSMLNLGKHEKALNLIENDFSEEAEFIRSQIYWSQKNWKLLIDLAASKLKCRENPNQTLSTFEQQLILKSTIAYLMENKRKEVLEMYHSFKDLIVIDPKANGTLKLLSDMASIFDIKYLDAAFLTLDIYSKIISSPEFESSLIDVLQNSEEKNDKNKEI